MTTDGSNSVLVAHIADALESAGPGRDYDGMADLAARVAQAQPELLSSAADYARGVMGAEAFLYQVRVAYARFNGASVTTWANGSGVWHARVLANVPAADYRLALDSIRAEVLLRDSRADVDVIDVEPVDTTLLTSPVNHLPGTVVFRETDPRAAAAEPGQGCTMGRSSLSGQSVCVKCGPECECYVCTEPETTPGPEYRWTIDSALDQLMTGETGPDWMPSDRSFSARAYIQARLGGLDQDAANAVEE